MVMDKISISFNLCLHHFFLYGLPYRICKTSFLFLVRISEPHNEGDTSTGMCHNRWMDAHLHFDDKSGRRIHAVLVFVLSFL